MLSFAAVLNLFASEAFLFSTTNSDSLLLLVLRVFAIEADWLLV